MKGPSYRRRAALLILGLSIAWGWSLIERQRSGDSDEDAIEELYATQRSGVMVEAKGEVSRVLSDDLEGSRHQRLIVRLASGHTVLISHNIDLAPRVEGVAPNSFATRTVEPSTTRGYSAARP